MRKIYDLNCFKNWVMKQFLVNDNSIDFVMYNEEHDKSLILTLNDVDSCTILEYGIEDNRYSLSEFIVVIKEYVNCDLYEVNVEYDNDIITSMKITLENDDILFEGNMKLTFDVAEMSDYPENLIDMFVNQVEPELDDIDIMREYNPVISKEAIDNDESLEQFSSEENRDYNERFEKFLKGYTKLCKKHNFMIEIGDLIDLEGLKKKKVKKLLKKNINSIKNF